MIFQVFMCCVIRAGFINFRGQILIMAQRIYAGKRKSGAKREYVIPSELHGPRGKVVWKEWEIKNRYRESMPAQLFDARGKPLHVEKSGLILDHRGKVIDSKLIERFTRREVLRDIAKERKKQKNFQWVDNRTREAGKVLTKLTTLKRQHEAEAMKMIAENTFFKVGLMKGELVIPENASLVKIYEIAQDYFFKKFSERNTSRKQELRDGAGRVVSFAKRLVK